LVDFVYSLQCLYVYLRILIKHGISSGQFHSSNFTLCVKNWIPALLQQDIRINHEMFSHSMWKC